MDGSATAEPHPRSAVATELMSRSWPISCSIVLGVIDTSVNVIWVGRELGDVSVAALSNANLLWSVLFAAAFGISTAGSVRVARSIGQGNPRGAKEALLVMVSVAIAVSLLCVLPVAIWAAGLLRCAGTPAVSLDQGIAYLRVMLISIPLAYPNATIIAALQAAGDRRVGFYVSLVVILIDATLNPILILGVGPIPRLGIVGSALATVTSQAVVLVGLGWYLLREGAALRVRLADVSLPSNIFISARGLLCEGTPTAILFLWTGFEEVLMISLVNRFGADVTAAYGVMTQIWGYILIPATALSLAITSMAAENIGAGRWDRARAAIRLALAYGAVASVVLVALADTVGGRAYELFLPPGSPSLAFASQINVDATWSLIFISGFTVWVGVLRAVSSVWAPLAISAGVLAVRFPVTAALLEHWRSQAIWWSFPASAVATAALAVLHGSFSVRSRLHLLRKGHHFAIRHAIARN